MIAGINEDDLYPCGVCTQDYQESGNSPSPFIKDGTVYHHVDLVHCCDGELVVSFGNDHRCPKCGPYNTIII